MNSGFIAGTIIGMLIWYLIGRILTRKAEPPDTKITVEEVDLEVHEYYPFLNPDWGLSREERIAQRKALNKAMNSPITTVHKR